MQIKNRQGNLHNPIYYFFLLKFFALYYLDKFIHITSLAIGHNNIEIAIGVNKRVSEWDNVDMLELFEKSELSLNSLSFFVGNVSHN